jgi:hypothetical protein
MENTLFGRKISLFVDNGKTGLDLSEMHIRFAVKQSDIATPNNLWARVYNLSRDTANRIGSEFSKVILQAGYENSNFGVIFTGTITQTVTGKERNVDSFVDIYAGDGDEFHNQCTVNRTLSAGATAADILDALTQKGSVQIPLATDTNKLIGGVSPVVFNRGKVLWGMSRDHLDGWAEKNGFKWSIQHGELVLVPITGYRDGEAVVLSSSTGLVGIPEATNDGVYARCLLNPLIRIGGLVQIAQNDLSKVNLVGSIGVNRQPQFAATTTAAGFYRVLVAEHQGDARGQNWYTDLMCLAVDVSAPANKSVKVAG